MGITKDFKIKKHLFTEWLKKSDNGCKIVKRQKGAVIMRKESSYPDNVKALAMMKEQKSKISLTEIYAQMMLDELIINQRINQLKDLIDAALEQNNKESFMLLSKEYNELTR